MENCLNCQFYDRKSVKPTDGRATMWGHCRRHSPHLNPVTARAYVVEGVWPIVRDDDWCGEWKTLVQVVDGRVPESLIDAAPQAPVRFRITTPATRATVASATTGDD